MKNLINALLIGFIFFFISCEEDDLSLERTPSEALQNTKEYVLNSRDNKGFSADLLRMADFPKSDADFIIIPQTSLTGDIMSPFLANPNLGMCFLLIDEFEDSKSAQTYFESNEEYPADKDLQQFALNLKSNQVWLVKAKSGSFCKIWILETRVDKTTSIVELKFKAQRVSQG